jgi:hypothetical protein
MIVKQLTALFGLETDKASFQQAEGGLDKLLGYAKQAAVAFAAIKVFDVFKDMAAEVAALGDKFDEMAQRTGASAQALQAWSYVAEGSGASAETVEGAIKKLSVAAEDAATGGKETGAAFKRLGINVKNADGSLKNAEQLMPEIADGLAGVTNDTERTALTMKVLGKSGTALLPMLKGGSKALNEQMQAAYDLGAVMDQDLIRASAEYDDAQNQMKMGLQGLKNIVGKALIPAMTGITKTMVNWIKANREWLATKFGPAIQRVGEGIARLFRLASDITNGIIEWTKTLDPLQKKFLLIGGIAAAIALLLMLPGGSILLLIGLIALIIEDFQTWREGGKSVIGDLVAWFQQLIDTIPGLGETMAMVWTTIKAYFQFMQDMVFAFIQFWIDMFTVGPVEAIQNLGNNVLMIFQALWDAVGGYITTALQWWWQLIAGFFTSIGQWISETVQGIMDGIVGIFVAGWNAVTESIKTAISFWWELFKQFGSFIYDTITAPFRAVKGLLAKVGIGGAEATSAAAGAGTLATAGPGAFGAGVATASPTTGGGGFSPTSNVSVSVNAAPGMNEEMLASAVAKHVAAENERTNRMAIRALSPAAAGAT